MTWISHSQFCQKAPEEESARKIHSFGEGYNECYQSNDRGPCHGVQVLFFHLMNIKKLTEICAQLKKNYDPIGPTAYDDRETFTQLDMDIVTLQSKVKFWEMNQQFYIPVESSNSKLEEMVKTGSKEM